MKIKYVQFLNKLKQDSLAGKPQMSSVAGLLNKGGKEAVSIFKERLEIAHFEAVEDPSKDYFFHGWVYIAISDTSGFFIESTTGEKHPLSHSAYKRSLSFVFL